ncbi:MAG: hypothetical protein R6V58_10515 [Planctomycetota bacterium]
MPRTPFILVFCGRHRYCFVYSKGNEEELISAMIEYAMDQRFNFGWSELRSITTHMQQESADRPDR